MAMGLLFQENHPCRKQQAKLDPDFVKRMNMCKFPYQCPMKSTSEGFFPVARGMTKRLGQMALQQWIGPIRTIQMILGIAPFKIWTRKIVETHAMLWSNWSYCLLVPHIILSLWNTNQNETFTLRIAPDFETCVGCLVMHMHNRIQAIHGICVFQVQSIQGLVPDPSCLRSSPSQEYYWNLEPRVLIEETNRQ